MADISKVQVGETQYDIKDETARGKVAGHVIKNASGTAVTQRANMQFKTAAVTDENGETVVRNVVQMTRAEYDLITPVEGVIYEITDETVTPSVVETVPIAQGGTGATTAAAARTNLGLGTAATKDSTTSVTDGGTGLPTSGAVYSAIDDVRTDLSDDEDQIDAIVNVYGSKNRLKNEAYTQTINGVTLTVYDDGSVKANGTSSADVQFLLRLMSNSEYVNIFGLGHKYILSGCPSGGASDKYMIRFHADPWGDNIEDYGDGVEFTVTDAAARVRRYAWIIIRSGVSVSNIMFYPMIRDASIKDSTYVPYAPTNRECVSYAVNGILGAKNRLNNIATTSTVQGCTFTINADKSVTMNRPTATASNADLTLSEDYLEQGTQLKLSAKGMPDSTTAKLVFFYASDYTVLNVAVANDDELFITIPRSGYYRSYIRVVADKTVSNVTVYPMLRLAADTDATYHPYAMTNMELTAGFIKCSKYDFSYTASLTAKNTQMVQVNVNEPKTRIIAMWVDCSSTNDRGSCNYVDTNKIAYVLITNEMGHSVAIPFNAHLYVLYI